MLKIAQKVIRAQPKTHKLWYICNNSMIAEKRLIKQDIGNIHGFRNKLRKLSESLSFSAPFPPDLNINRAYGYDVSRIRVSAYSHYQLKTTPIGKIDQYKLMGVTNTSSGDPVLFTATPANPASVSTQMYITLPEAGRSYELSFASIITSHCGGVSIYSERWTNITRCTGMSVNQILQ